MGRPPSNGGPAFRFAPAEVVEMEGILQEHHNGMPSREILMGLAEKFSESPERKGKIIVQMKQVWNWFQNKRYAIRAKSIKSPGKLSVTPMAQDDSAPVRNIPQTVAAPISASAPASIPASMPTSMPIPMPVPMPASTPASTLAPLVSSAGMAASDNTFMEFEAKSARDGAWYDVAAFLARRNSETGDPEVQVRFAGFGAEEDEWVNIKRHFRQRSLPCEASECVAVLPGDLILCFQEGKDQALYFDAHVLDAQRRRHDVRGCRCRFLVRYDHDQSEEIVPIRKLCRRPETDYRLQQLHAMNDLANTDQQKTGAGLSAPGVISSSADVMQKQGNTYIAPTVPVFNSNVSVAPQTTTTEAKNAGAITGISTSNPVVPPNGAAIISSTAATSAATGSSS